MVARIAVVIAVVVFLGLLLTPALRHPEQKVRTEKPAALKSADVPDRDLIIWWHKVQPNETLNGIFHRHKKLYEPELLNASYSAMKLMRKKLSEFIYPNELVPIEFRVDDGRPVITKCLHDRVESIKIRHGEMISHMLP